MIRGKLSRLRAIEAKDVNLYHSWINDDDTNQWRGLHHPHSKEACSKWIDLQRTQRPEALSLAVETDDGVLVGLIGLSEICARSRRAEVWIYLGSKPHWNKGIGEDAVRTLCNYAFEQMNLFRISLECNPEYTNVVKCYEKVGFVREGTLRKAYYRHGDFRDTCIMGLLRNEFSGGDL